MFIERCVTNLSEAKQAVAEGANRLELCSALELDGLTANRAEFLDIKQNLEVPVRVMLRNSHPGFDVSERELGELQADADWFKSHGADGFVFGFAGCGAIDVAATLNLLSHCAPLPCTFHKAFDTCLSLTNSLESLIEWRFSSVLTSGGAKTASAGAEKLASLVAQAAGRIEVIVAGKVRQDNLLALNSSIKGSHYHYRVE